ncbi:MAM and LDL-receptor class A domain-containing protein 1-like [Penaeus japonicus]|uniref:MAM and LDL-receptor class A domain-containing protein 1-like n=1 Tax=Penaeus japonicus TaxID=27405 RepID=UPI001C714450|nr:MAM and LDL-receptor class A domain-containing protein 1-like [Penaeus japonicus]
MAPARLLGALLLLLAQGAGGQAPQWTCTFEESKGLCGWEISGGMRVTRGQVSLHAPREIRREKDDSRRQSEGEATKEEFGSIVSPAILPSRDCLLRVHYALHGRSSSLHIRQVTRPDDTVVREKVLTPSQDAGQWQESAIPFASVRSFAIVLEGQVGTEGHVIIDNVTLTGECVESLTSAAAPSAFASPCDEETQFKCHFSTVCLSLDQVCDFHADCPDGDDEASCGTTDFEQDLGGWEDVSDNEDSAYGWSRIAAVEATYPHGTAPSHDHTLAGTQEGYFMWAPGSSQGDDVYSGTTAIVQSPTIGPPSVPCKLVFWYQTVLGGPEIRVILGTTEDDWVWAKSVTPSAVSEWRRARIEIGEYETKIFIQMIINLNVINEVSYDVCVDDVVFQDCASDTPPSKDDVICTFDVACELFQSHSDDSSWSREVYDDPDNVYLETSSPGSSVLQTWWRPPSVEFCVSFRYVVQESTRLRILLVTDNNTEEVWVRENSGISAWRTQHLQLSSAEKYQIHIDGVIMEEKDNYVFLDDVKIMEGRCPASFTCTFDEEEEMCLWENYDHEAATSDWALGSGEDGTPGTPP